MLFWTTVKVAVRSLLAHKLRSFLAMLGIIIGVGAVVSMLALGAGAKKQIMDRVTSMGTNLLIVRPSRYRRGGVRSGARANLKLEDAKIILEQVDGVKAVAPVVSGRVQVKYYNKNSDTSVVGSSLTYMRIRSFNIEKGRIFTSVEEERRARVAILGSAVAEELFEKQEPVGESIKVNGKKFRVIGVLKTKGDQGWYNPDDMVVIPYSTAMKQIIGRDYLSEIDVQAEKGADLAVIEENVTKVLKKQHKLGEEDENDFRIRNQAELIETVSDVSRTFTFLLGGIASISLLVGGIGIMNIMLVTVTERTREIGVRKAIGAHNRDILRQFLFESILISGLGGLFGLAAGVGGAWTVGHFSQFTTVIEYNSMILSLTVSGSVGIFFGYYPAMRAARLDPIVALRAE
jgi:putative ABC transport system permease protein